MHFCKLEICKSNSDAKGNQLIHLKALQSTIAGIGGSMFYYSAIFYSLCVCALTTLATAQSNVNLTSLLDWKPPSNFHQKIRQYISGFDKGGRPVLIWEFGKWQTREITDQGPEMAAAAGLYMEQMAQVSIQLAETFKEEGGVTFLVDFQGFSLLQLTHLPTMRTYLLFTRYAIPLAQAQHEAIVINVSYIGQRFVSFIQPFIPDLYAKSEILGTNKDIWLPKVLAGIDKSQLPLQFGGPKDWKPLQVLGKGEPLDVGFLRNKNIEFKGYGFDQ